MIPVLHHPLKAWCPDPMITKQPLPFKKHPFSPKFVKCANLWIHTDREEKHGHFWPCQLWSHIPSIPMESTRQRVYLGVKTRWVHCILPNLTQKCCKILTFVCHLNMLHDGRGGASKKSGFKGKQRKGNFPAMPRAELTKRSPQLFVQIISW